MLKPAVVMAEPVAASVVSALVEPLPRPMKNQPAAASEVLFSTRLAGVSGREPSHNSPPTELVCVPDPSNVSVPPSTRNPWLTMPMALAPGLVSVRLPAPVLVRLPPLVTTGPPSVRSLAAWMPLPVASMVNPRSMLTAGPW